MIDPHEAIRVSKPRARDKPRDISYHAVHRKSVLHQQRASSRLSGPHHRSPLSPTNPVHTSPRLSDSSSSILSSEERTSDDDGDDDFSSWPPTKPLRKIGPRYDKFGWSSSDSSSTARSTSPVTILRKGNSDPFDSISIPINASANSLISFYRDVEIPSLYFLDSKSWVTSAAAVKDWTDNCQALVRDKCFAYAFLARNATVVAMVSERPHLTKQALEYRARSTTLLRAKLADKRLIQSPQTLQAIRGLFGAEVLARNQAGASVHGKMLRFLFEKLSETTKIDLVTLNQVLYNDTQLAAMCLTRPSFDLDVWLPTIFAPSWNAVADDLPSLSAASTTFIDPAIDSETLRTIFVRRREAMIVWLQSAASKPKGSPLVMNWLISRNLISQGRLINHYLDMVERLDHPDEELFDHHCAQAYLSLTALYWTRAVSTSPQIRGISLFNAEPKILTNLQNELIRSETTSNPAQASKYINARLWALYVGARAEQARTRPGFDPTQGWFNLRLGKQARSMGLMSWQQVRQVLEGFLYTDHLKPHGSQWFFKTMGASLESGGLSVQ